MLGDLFQLKVMRLSIEFPVLLMKFVQIIAGTFLIDLNYFKALHDGYLLKRIKLFQSDKTHSKRVKRKIIKLSVCSQR